MQNMEETRYRMHLYWYKQKIRQCEILLAHTGSIQTLKAISPSLASSVKSMISPTQCSGQVPSQGTREMGQPSIAKLDAAQPYVLAAVQQITQSLLLTSCTTSGSIYLIYSEEANVTGTQGQPSRTTTKKQVGNVKPIPRSVSNNTQELRISLPNQVHSPSPVWLYHSNWSEDLYPPHIRPPSPLNSHQSWFGLCYLGTVNSRTKAPLIVTEMPSPDIPNRELRPLGVRRDSSRGVWAPR